jgi:hypothetical protein
MPHVAVAFPESDFVIVGSDHGSRQLPPVAQHDGLTRNLGLQ